MLCIENSEHSLIEMAEKLFECFWQVDFTVVVIIFEVFEEIDEHIRVAFVNDTIRFLKQLVKLELALDQKLGEELCKKEGKNLNLSRIIILPNIF